MKPDASPSKLTTNFNFYHNFGFISRDYSRCFSGSFHLHQHSLQASGAGPSHVFFYFIESITFVFLLAYSLGNSRTLVKASLINF
uniref:Uncharacterized protein n=1 Tax=Strigamia maritima TaxID=126957 RepID=T1JG86_STRMM